MSKRLDSFIVDFLSQWSFHKPSITCEDGWDSAYLDWFKGDSFVTCGIYWPDDSAIAEIEIFYRLSMSSLSYTTKFTSRSPTLAIEQLIELAKHIPIIAEAFCTKQTD